MAPPPAAPPAQTTDLRGVSLAIWAAAAENDFAVCMNTPQVIADLQGGALQELEYFGHWGSKTILTESKAFSAEEKAAAARLAGFVPPQKEGWNIGLSEGQEALEAALQRVMDETADSEREKAIRLEMADLRKRLKAGQLKAAPEDLRAACFGVTGAAMRKGRGPMVEMLRSYIKELTAEYSAYRSTEGHLAARWGMTPAEVAKAEGLPLAALKSGKVVRIDGNPAKASYQFTDGRLSEVTVTFDPGCKPAACLNRYRTVHHLLVEKYGEGKDSSYTNEQALRENSSILFEGMGRERYPWMLIEHGFRKEEHGWETGESFVLHTLMSSKKPLQKDSTSLVHTVRYLSNKFLLRAEYLRQQQEEADKKKRLQNL